MPIHTDRLLIRPMKADDWHGNQSIIRDFNRSDCRIYDMPLPEEDDQVKDLTAQWSKTGLFFSVFLMSTSEMIGYVCFHRDNGNYDLGYCFHSGYHNKGYAYESCTALMREMAHRNNVRCFTASTALENKPSCRLLEKLGFILMETERVSFHKDACGNDISFTGGNFIKHTKNYK